MNDQDKTKEELIKELQKLKQENNSLKTSYQIDIAEHQLAEKLISDIAKNLEDSQKLAKIGSWKSDLTTNTVEWSAELCRMNQYDPKLPVPSFSEMSRFYTLESWDRLNVALTNAFNKGEPYGLDLEQVRMDGTIFHTIARGVPDYDDSGKMIGLHGTVQDITERILAEQALQESKDRIQAMFQTIPDMMFRLDRQGVFLDYKADVGDLYAQYDSTIIGKRNRDITPIEFADLIDLKIRTTLETGSLKTFEYQLPIPGRGMRYYEARMAVSGTDEVTAIVRDITERKEAEEEILSHSRELATLLRISQEFATTLDLAKILQIIADRVTELTELKSSAIYLLEGETLRLWATTPPLPPKFPDELRIAPLADHPHIRKAITTGLPVFLFDTINANLTAAERDVCELRSLRSILYLPLFVGTQALGVLIVTTSEELHSLTEAEVNLFKTFANLAAMGVGNARLYESQKSYAREQQNLVVELKQTEEALMKSEKRYRDLFNQANEGLLIMTPKGQLSDLNQAFAEMHGYTVNELMNYDIRKLDVLGDKTLEDRADRVDRMFDGEVVRFEVEHFHKDGHIFPLSVTASLIIIDDQQFFLAFHQDITKRKQAEEELRYSEASLRESQSIAKMGSWELDIIKQKAKWSENCFIIYGLKPFGIEPTYEYFRSRVHPDDLNLVDKYFENIFINKIPVECDMRIIFPDGSFKWFRNSMVPIIQDDKLVVIKGINIDITELKQVEEEQRRLVMLLDVASCAIAAHDTEGKFLYANQKILDLHGYTPKEFMSLNVKQLDVPESRELFESRIKELSDRGEAIFKGSHFRKDGTILPLEIFAKLTTWDNNNIILSVATDITERLSIEKALLKNEKELKRAQEITHIGSFSIDLTTNEMTWTEELYKMYGFNPTLPPPILDESQKLFTPDSWALLSSSIANTGVTGDAYEIELKTVRNDGSHGWIWARGEAIVNENGKITEIRGAVQDISERKMKEQELAAAKSRAEESDRLKSAFLANMSHEIRTPMNGILGFASLLKEPNLTGDEQQNYIRIIEKSGARMLNIINDIIDISKIEAGLMKLEMKESNINEQIEYIYTFFKPEIEAKGIKFSFKYTIPAKEGIIKTDREKLYAILTNLVKNAIKYTNEGSIEFGYLKKGDHLEFYVKDTGIGVQKERQEAIFERFIQADIEDKMARQGAGLGLAITKSYVKMLGGKIWIESEEGIGSTFYFTLPYNSEPVIEAIDPQLEPSGKTDNVRKLKILIAEDDEVSEMLIDIMVKTFGKEILKVRTGVEAVEACLDNPDIDLVLMDILLPEMNGYKATQQIRQFNKDVIIIAQTAFGLEGDREKSIEAGCNDYLSKPINKDELLALIQKYFKK